MAGGSWPGSRPGTRQSIVHKTSETHHPEGDVVSAKGSLRAGDREALIEEVASLLEGHKEEAESCFRDWASDLRRIQQEHAKLCNSLSRRLNSRKASKQQFISAPLSVPPSLVIASAWTEPMPPTSEGKRPLPESSSTTAVTEFTAPGVVERTTVDSLQSVQIVQPINPNAAMRRGSVASRFSDPIALLYGVEREAATPSRWKTGVPPSQSKKFSEVESGIFHNLANSPMLKSFFSLLTLLSNTMIGVHDEVFVWQPGCCRRFTQGVCVRFICSLMILVNAVFMGFHAEEELKSYTTRQVGEEIQLDPVWEWAELGFCIFFFLELLLRLVADPKRFVTSSETPWNMFDTFLVLLSVVDIFLTRFTSTSAVNLTFARTLRIFRFARILRLVRVMRFFYSFRLMVYAVLYSIGSLLWVFLMLLFVMYFFAMFFIHGVAEHFKFTNVLATDSCAEDDLECWFNHQLKMHFGTIFDTLVSLFMGISGGIDWGELKDSLTYVSPAYGMVFLCYIFFMIFGVLNVVIASFVDSASQISRKDRELVTQNEIEKNVQYAQNIRRFFHEADVDNTGTLSWEEFESYLQNDKVQAYFQSFELDVSQARTLFKLLDLDESNDVGIDEFVEGCMRMKGPARSIDVNMLLYESEKMIDRQVEFMGFVEEQFAALEPTRSSMPDQPHSNPISRPNSRGSHRRALKRTWSRLNTRLSTRRPGPVVLSDNNNPSSRQSRAVGIFDIGFFETDV